MACGRRGPQAGFARFHVETMGAQAFVAGDVGGKRQGRGAYLCRQLVCLDQALRRRAFPRAFRRTVVADREALLPAVISGDGNKDGR